MGTVVALGYRLGPVNQNQTRLTVGIIKCRERIKTVKIISNVNPVSISEAAKAMRLGYLIAFPTETVYGLGADASNELAVRRLYEVKNRPFSHPSIIHISSLKKIDFWVQEISGYALNLANTFWPGPMTLILDRTKNAKDFLTGAQDCIGIRIPDNFIAQSLLRDFENLGGHGVVAPSANRFGKVSPTTPEAVVSELSSYMDNNDRLLDGGSCQIGLESTIIDCRGNYPIILRPGFITKEMVDRILLKTTEVKPNHNLEYLTLKFSGSMKSHYAPNARVFLEGTPSPGDGFIAISKIETPEGVIRLSSPANNIEYARELYASLRSADEIGLKNIFITSNNIFLCNII
jgi:L-threonylcarbamoyladenylate synthase